MYENILFGYSHTLVGVPPSPGPGAPRPVEHAFGVALSLPAVAPSCTSAQEDESLSGFIFIPYRTIEN